MCGIAAIFSYRGKAGPVDQAELARIRDHMRARGPDGRGMWCSRDGHVGLAHRRLSIIDPSERGAQPMASADGRRVISYNGEIYNFRELREELERKGHAFRSQCDTEVLLQLYDEHGERMVHRLRGMFAFALWDADRRALLCARDPYGIKPLYYADDGCAVRVASQVKALRAGGRISRAPDPAGLAGFLLFGSVPEPYTTCRSIRALPAGSTMWVDERGAAEPRRYFSIAQVFRDAQGAAAPADAAEVQAAIGEALRDSVRAHQVADVPVGAFLSAGVDSSALVALACETGAREIQTITLGFEEFRGQAVDETPLAADIARRYRTRHSTRMVARAEFDHELPRIFEAMDQPSIDGANSYLISKAAAEAGLKVVLSGLGGDELLGGYSSFQQVPGWVRLLRWPSRVPALGAAFRRLCWPLLRRQRSVSPKLAGLLHHGGDWTGAYLLKRGLFMPWELGELMGEEQAREGLARLRPLELIGARLQPDPGSDFARVAVLEASMYMRTQLLRDSDWASMAHSVELRPPLVDAELLRRLAPLLLSLDGVPGKRWLADAPAEPLSPAIVQRPKTGFSLPLETWVDDALSRRHGLGKPLPPSARAHWSRRLALVVAAELDLA